MNTSPHLDLLAALDAAGMLAHAFLTVMAATQPGSPPDADLIPLTRHEIRRLFSVLHITISRPVANTTHEPARATTADKMQDSHDHGLWLDY